jgi:hypothetical protein
MGLKSTAVIHVQHDVEDDGRFECGSRDPSRTDHNQTSGFEGPQVKSETPNSAILSPVAADYRNGGGIPSFVSSLTSKVDEVGDLTTIAFIYDQKTPNFYQNQEEGCSDNKIFHTVRTHETNGWAQFEYEVPADVWGIDVTSTGFDSVFKYAEFEEAGSLGGDPSSAPHRRLWVKPGTKLRMKISLSKITASTSNRGAIQWQIKPIGRTISNVDESNGIVRAVLNATKNNGRLVKTQEAIVQYVENGFTLLRNIGLLREHVKSAKMEEIWNTVNGLFEVANLPYDEAKDGALKLHRHAISAVLAYETGSLLMEDMESFCRSIDVELPYSKQTVNVQGIQYANFLLKRAMFQITDYNFSAHEKFLGELYEYQKKGWSYHDLMSSEADRVRMRDAAGVYRSRAKLYSRPFLEALVTLKQMFQVFRSIGSGENSTDEILKKVDALALLEYKFVTDIFSHLNEYKRGNTQPIDVDALIQTFENLRLKQIELKSRFIEASRFLDVRDDVDAPKLTDLVTNIKVHPLNVLGNDPGIENFEPIRKAYLQTDRHNKNLKTFNQCIYLD